MDFSGRYVVPGAPETVWRALHDAEVLRACVPGCESLIRLSETDFEARMMLKIGPIKARFAGKVRWVDHAAPDGFTHAGTLTGEGQGGAAGFAQGEAQIRLARLGDAVTLSYDAKAIVGGQLAQTGRPVIEACARSLADSFFSKFAGLMRANAAASQAGYPDDAAVAPGEGLRPQIWVAGLIGIVIILLIVFSLVL